MIKAIGCNEFLCARNTQRQVFKSAASPVNLSNDVGGNYAKIPLLTYQIAFMGTDYHPVNSRREYVDYGNTLYFGPLSSVIKEDDERSRTRAKAKGADLQNKDLSNYIFTKGAFHEAKFNNSKLERTKFESANLWGADLSGVQTKNTNFDHANLTRTNFHNAKFGTNTSMVGASLFETDLSNTDLSYVKLQDALYDSETKFPRGFDPVEEGMILFEDGADLSNLKNQLERAKIRHMSIADATFENSSLKRADLKHWIVGATSFKNTNLTRAYAREMVAMECDFTGAKMKQINFDDAEFLNVDMSNSDLRGARFTYKRAENLKLEGAKYDQYTVFNEGFNPKEHGMVFETSHPGVYGEKEPS